MSDNGQVERRLLLSVDARGYGEAPGDLQREIQTGLLHVLDEAARHTGLRRPEWERQPAGDGELAVLPRDEPEGLVVGRFPEELRDALRKYNRFRTPEARLRLRLAVHYGGATPGDNGRAGQGPVTVSRLCDAEPLRRALASSGADLAVICSRQIFDDTIRQGLTRLDPADLLKVRATVKNFDEEAWIWIPGHHHPGPGGEFDRAEGPEPDPRSGQPAGQSAGQPGERGGQRARAGQDGYAYAGAVVPAAGIGTAHIR